MLKLYLNLQWISLWISSTNFKLRLANYSFSFATRVLMNLCRKSFSSVMILLDGSDSLTYNNKERRGEKMSVQLQVADDHLLHIPRDGRISFLSSSDTLQLHNSVVQIHLLVGTASLSFSFQVKLKRAAHHPLHFGWIEVWPLVYYTSSSTYVLCHLFNLLLAVPNNQIK